MSIERVCIRSVDQHEAEFIEMAKAIWENPEVGYKEFLASQLYA